jgi:hypothetical protein
MDITPSFVSILYQKNLDRESVIITTIRMTFLEVIKGVEYPHNRKIYHSWQQTGINWIVIDQMMLAASDDIKLRGLAMRQWFTSGEKKALNYIRLSKRCTITAPTL